MPWHFVQQLKSKKVKLSITGLLWRKSTNNRCISSQIPSYTESVIMSWCRHDRRQTFALNKWWLCLLMQKCLTELAIGNTNACSHEGVIIGRSHDYIRYIFTYVHTFIECVARMFPWLWSELESIMAHDFIKRYNFQQYGRLKYPILKLIFCSEYKLNLRVCFYTVRSTVCLIVNRFQFMWNLIWNLQQ